MNDAPIDPYWLWLGISPDNQPRTHYVLFGLPAFEPDPAVIHSAALQRISVVEAQLGGPEEAHCRQLLIELRAARDCLLNPVAKASYDAVLRSHEEAISTAIPIASPAPLSTPPDVVPLAPPVGSDGQDDSIEQPVARMSVAGWLLSIVSLLVMGGAGWLLVSTWLDRDGGVAQKDPPETKSPNDNPALPSGVDQERGAGGSLRQGPPEPVVVMQESTGAVLLRAVSADITNVDLDTAGEFDLLVSWTDTSQARWHFRVIKGGVYRIVVRYSAKQAWEGARYEIAIDAKTKACEVRSSEGEFHEDEYYLAITSAGQHQLTLRALDLAGGGLLTLQSVTLEPP